MNFLYFWHILGRTKGLYWELLRAELQKLQKRSLIYRFIRVRFFGRIRKRICDPRSYGFFDAKETQNPKKDYFVMTRQAGGTQYIYRIQLEWNTNNL